MLRPREVCEKLGINYATLSTTFFSIALANTRSS